MPLFLLFLLSWYIHGIPKVLFLAPYFSLCTPLLLVPLSLLSLSLNHHLYADDTQFFLSFYAHDFHSNITVLQNALQHISSCLTANLLTHDTSKTEFLLIGLKQQLANIQNCTLNTTHSARNLGFIFDEHLTFSDQISALSKSCYSNICELCCIRRYLDFKTANTIATSIVHSKLDYCNSLHVLFSVKQTSTNPELSTLFLVLLLKPPSSLTPLLFSDLYWLRVSQHIEYKVFLLHINYKVITTAQTGCLQNLISVKSHCIETHSSFFVTFCQPSSSSSLKITDRSFRYASPCIWNKLPASFRQPNPDYFFSHSSHPNHQSPSLPSSPLSLSITPTLF